MQHSTGAATAPPGLQQAHYPAGGDTSIIAGTGPQQTAIAPNSQIQEAHSTTNHGQTTIHQVQDTESSMENDKRAIYRHPLFPLMALLFEKCEQATQGPDAASAESFDCDIQSFVQHQEHDRKPFFSEDKELDNLMVKAIQVLRIHLLELEKVQELCKDFCQRYIACLKGKLQSENLLRNDIPGLEMDSDSQSSTTSGNQGILGGSNSVMGGVVGNNNNLVSNNGNQVVAGQTVYQMVQTPQGLVAQPIQIQTTVANQSPGSVIHGSTPLSQIGVSPNQNQANQATSPTTAMMQNYFNDDDDLLGKRKNKRGVLPKMATQVMKSWLFQHIVHPYPTEDEKRQIASQTNLSLLQVNNWFINARRRILQPMLDASNPEQKVKKTKPQNRPVQRFWPENLANMHPTGGSASSPGSEEEEEEEERDEMEGMNSGGEEELEEDEEDLVRQHSSQPVSIK